MPEYPSTKKYPDVVSCYEGDGREWDCYVDTHPAASFYQSMAWRRVIQKSCRHQCFYLMARRNDQPVGVLPLTLVKSRIFGIYLVSPAFGDVGGVCSDDRDSGEALLAAAESLRKQVHAEYIELRQSSPLPHMGLVTSDLKVMPVLALPRSKEELWNGFDSKLRNQIRKAEKSSLEPLWGAGELVEDFYQVYARNMRDLGTPVIGIRFFHNLVHEFGNSLKILVLYKGNLPISGAIGICYRGTFEVPWASSSRRWFALNPNNRLYWEMLSWCIDNRILFFNFGRSSKDSGAYRFKKQWDPVPHPLYYQFAGDKNSVTTRDPHSSRYAIAIRFWQKMPVRLSTWIGPWFAKDLT